MEIQQLVREGKMQRIKSSAVLHAGGGSGVPARPGGLKRSRTQSVNSGALPCPVSHACCSLTQRLHVGMCITPLAAAGLLTAPAQSEPLAPGEKQGPRTL